MKLLDEVIETLREARSDASTDNGYEFFNELVEKLEEIDDEVQNLENRDGLLECLKACGVDNWDGFSDAVNLFEEEY
jgi:hypothetical protein